MIQVLKLVRVFGEVLLNMLHNDELYQRIVKDLLLKCLGSDQARVAMGEVNESIYGTH
jgi:hypothetical protein